MAALAGRPVNGLISTTPANSADDIREYEKILRIRDQVFAGSHPRLTVPAHALRKSSPKLPQVLPIPAQTHAEPKPPTLDQSKVQFPGLHMNGNDTAQTTTNIAMPNGYNPPNVRQAPHATASGIDPIFLTKSDELLKAELHLQRQRLEKQLREHFEKKKSDARHKPHPEEVQPEVNITVLLPKLTDILNPPAQTNASAPNDRPSSSGSFDENSLYSSRAPDSTPEEGALSDHSPPAKHQVQPRVLNDLDADGPVDQRAARPQDVDMTDAPYRVNARPEHIKQPPIQFPFDLRRDRGLLAGIDAVDLTAMDMNEDDEPEYYPPEPTEQFGTNHASSRLDYRDPRNRPLRRYSGAGQHESRPGSPHEDHMRIVRNHITSPLAPQPSRVSPLAVAKAPPLSQNTHPRRDRGRQHGVQLDSSRQSPDYAQPSDLRKKRKMDKRAEKRAAKKRNNNQAGSPQPFVKDEPVSPPPFHDVQPLGSVKTRGANINRPVYVDDPPPREIRYAPAQEQFYEPSPHQIVYDEPPMPRSDPRPFSRASVRPLMREDQDLRRVASMHNMRDQGHDYMDVQYDTPTRARAPSHAVVDSPMRAPSARYYPESGDRSAGREERAMRSPAPSYRDLEPEIRYRPQSMAPPPVKRLVQDQYGNQFYEIIRMAPVPAPYGESGYARTRATSVFAEPPSERPYMREMPPPDVTYHRVTEVPRTPVVDSRQLARDPADPSRVQRSGSVQVADYPQRQPVYFDDRAQPREPVRMASVRPPANRYEDVPMPPPRGQSVRPSGREGSVFVEDRPQVRREYMPVQQDHPVYRRMVQDGGVQYY